MDVSLHDENAWLRSQLQEQQTTICQMKEDNWPLSTRAVAYAAEINRLKAGFVKQQRMTFGKSSVKQREKTERQLREAQERIGALPVEALGEQPDPILPQLLCQSSVRKSQPALSPYEIRTGVYPTQPLMGYSGILQMDARRKIHDFHIRIIPTDIITEALRRIGGQYATEAKIRGSPAAEERLAVRIARTTPRSHCTTGYRRR